VLDAADNVAVATVALAAGERIEAGDSAVTLAEPIPVGHKLALRAIAEGAHVCKYGEVIGIAISAIPAGAHVHVHNVLSARLPGDAAR
jgi:altronate dehydratase